MNLTQTPQKAGLVIAAFFLAGCVGEQGLPRVSLEAPPATQEAASAADPDRSAPAPAPTAPAANPPEPAQPIAWSLEACKTAIAGIPMEAAKLAPVLPAGFVPLTPEELLGQPDPRGNALLMLLIQRCDRADGPDGPLTDVAFGDFHVPVRAPSGLNVTAQLHAVRIDPLLSGPTLRETVRAQGGRALNGSVDFREDGPVGSWRHVRATMGLDGATFVVEGMPAVPVAGKEEFSYAAYTALPDGRFFVWTSRALNADFTVGEGHAELAPGWARDAVGAETYYAPYVMHTVQSHADARLAIVERQAA